jgi:catechol 2,3-dioxygenase-like lactoylglutathione lyase family enzyme
MTPAFSHVGICVSDLDRSLRFYCEALGFTVADSHDIGDEFGRLMELEGVKLRSQFIQHESGMRLELLFFDSPIADGSRVRRRVNQFGLTHLSFRVPGVDAVAKRIRELGGEVHDHTRTTFGTGEDALDFVYCSDPDGVRIELMKLGRLT